MNAICKTCGTNHPQGYCYGLTGVSQQPPNAPVWDGEGLPPVGCECEIARVADWMPVTIRFISDYHTIFKTLGGTEDCYQTCSLQFRPIRTVAERKREEALQALSKVLLVAYSDDGDDSGTEAHIYDAIAAGKIPGIRLTDDAGE